MKRLLATMLSVAMALSLVACGGGQSNGSATSKSDASTSGSSAPASSSAEKVDLGTELVLYSTMTEGDLDALITCFNEVYPDIEIEVVNGSAGELTARIQGEAAAPVGDLVWGGMGDSDGEKYADIFEKWISVNDTQNMPGYTSRNGLYSMEHLSTVVFCVNEELEAQLGVEIKSYADLLNPALKGKIILSDPNSSSAAWNNLCNIMAVFGNDSDAAWDYMEQLMPNLVIASSSSACFKSVQQGEYVVGMTYEDGAVKLLKDGATNIRLQYPEEGTSATAFGSALIKGAPHKAAAQAMIDFLCSAEGQTALAAYMEGTLRFTNAGYKVPENAWLLPTSEIKWVDRDVDYLTANKDNILAHWNDLFSKVPG